MTCLIPRTSMPFSYHGSPTLVVPCTQMARSLVMWPSSTVRMTARSMSVQNLSSSAVVGYQEPSLQSGSWAPMHCCSQWSQHAINRPHRPSVQAHRRCRPAWRGARGRGSRQRWRRWGWWRWGCPSGTHASAASPCLLEGRDGTAAILVPNKLNGRPGCLSEPHQCCVTVPAFGCPRVAGAVNAG